MIYSIYNSPSNTFNQNDLKLIYNSSPTILSAGDFNAKHTSWGSRVANTYGKKLHDFCINSNLNVCAPDTFTHYPYSQNGRPKKPDIIDFSISKNFPFKINAEVSHSLVSDHCPIIFTIDLTYNSESCMPKYNFAKSNWEKFSNSLWDKKPQTDELNSPKEVDESILKLTKCIQGAIKNSTPLRKGEDGGPPLPNHILQLIRERGDVVSSNRRNPNPFDKMHINRLRKQIDKAIRTHRCDKWNETVTNLNIKDHTLWKMTKVLTRSQVKIPPLKDDTGELRYFSPLDKANKFAEYFATTMTPHDDPSDKDFIEETDKFVADFLEKPCLSEIAPTDISEIYNYIKNLKNNKAPGEDSITNFILKRLPVFILDIIVDIINACFKLKYFPQLWKKAIILVFQKAGKDPRLASSYRPISLLNTLSKLLEAIFSIRLDNFTHENNIICKEQFGFRHQHSTQQQIIRITEFITDNFNKNRNTGAVLLDEAKAFDSVWHNGLIRKLIELNFPDSQIHFINSYLKNRKFSVKVGNTLSKEMDIQSGVPQGSIVGPKLYIIYANDCPTHPEVMSGIYADDKIYLASSLDSSKIVRLLNEQLELSNNWFRKWRVKINPDKSEAIMFGFNQKVRRSSKASNTKKVKDLKPPVLNNNPIAWKSHVGYLGVILDNKLKFHIHTTKIRNKATGSISKLYPLLKNHSALGINNGMIIYKMLIRPVLTYAPAVWGGTAKSNMLKIQKIQNRVLKMITKAPRYTRMDRLHKELEIEPISEHIKKLSKDFYDRCKVSSYETIKNLGSYSFDPGIKKERPKDFLFK